MPMAPKKTMSYYPNGAGTLGSILLGYMPLATQNPYPIIDYIISVANKLKTPSELLNILAQMFQLTFFKLWSKHGM